MSPGALRSSSRLADAEAFVFLFGPFGFGAPSVPAEHVTVAPSGDGHELGFVASPHEPFVRERVAEHMGVNFDA